MQNILKKLAAFLGLLTLFVPLANAKPNSCEWLEGGGAMNFAFIKETDGRIFHLTAESRSWHWKSHALGYHTMIVDCRTCFFGPSASATHTFYPPKNPLPKPIVKTLKPGSFGFWWHRRFDSRRIRGAPVKISFNGFKGWALAIEASYKGKVTHDIVEVKVSNGCAGFNLRIEAPPANDDKPMTNVKSLISAIRITKTDLDDHPQGQQYRVWLKTWLKKKKHRATIRSQTKPVGQSNN